jgi:hypothetical protein
MPFIVLTKLIIQTILYDHIKEEISCIISSVTLLRAI